MPKKKTLEEFKNEVFELVGGEYVVLDSYLGANIKTSFKHTSCGNTFSMTPHNFLHGQRCPKERYIRIANSIKLSNYEFKMRVQNLVGDSYVFLNDYVNAKYKLPVFHVDCGSVYSVAPSDFIQGSRCPKCSLIKRSIKRAKTTKQYKQEVLREVGTEYQVLGKYINWCTPILMKHTKCGNTYSCQPNSFIQGRRCPRCSSSYGEQWILSYLDKHNISYEYQKKFDDLKDKRQLSYDFYLADYNLLIEYQGQQHYEDRFIFKSNGGYSTQHIHDQLKRDYAKIHGIYLEEIIYDKANNPTKLNNIMDKIIYKYVNQRALTQA